MLANKNKVEPGAYYLENFGIENLSLKPCSQSDPAPDEVQVRIRAASLNYRDLLVIKGHYDPQALIAGPLIPLSDAAGEVVSIGTRVTRFKLGDKVAATFFQNWLSGPFSYEATKSALGGSLPGVLTYHRNFHQDGLVKIPTNFTYEEAATLPCAAVTAWNALIETNNIRPGETVLLQGTGGVSIFALQISKMIGARVILLSSSEAKLNRAKALGADHLINYQEIPEWSTTVRKLTDGRGADHIIEVGGAQTLSQSLKAISHGGKIALIGVLTGTESGVNILPVLMKAIKINGIYVGSRNMFESMILAMSNNNVRPIIDKIFSFANAKDAVHYFETATHFGKVVIKLD